MPPFWIQRKVAVLNRHLSRALPRVILVAMVHSVCITSSFSEIFFAWMTFSGKFPVQSFFHPKNGILFRYFNPFFRVVTWLLQSFIMLVGRRVSNDGNGGSHKCWLFLSSTLLHESRVVCNVYCSPWWARWLGRGASGLRSFSLIFFFLFAVLLKFDFGCSAFWEGNGGKFIGIPCVMLIWKIHCSISDNCDGKRYNRRSLTNGI